MALFKYLVSRSAYFLSRFTYLLSRSNIVFLASVLCGLILPQANVVAAALTLPALTVILTITPLKIPRGFFRRSKKLTTPALRGNVINYLLWGNFIILTGIFFILDENFWIGMVLIAAAPPALAVIPLSNSLKADTTSSIAGLTGTYLGALLIAPLIVLGFIKDVPFNDWTCIFLAVELIILPLVVSRIAVEKDWDKLIEPYEGIIIDCCFFIVFYSITANGRDVIMNWPDDLSSVTFIAVIGIFLIALAIGKIGELFHVAEKKITSLLLLGTMKNYGLSGGIALIIFSREAALPSLIFATITFFYVNWLKYKMGHNTAGSSKRH
jgi:bile acid:Na+ symporter, BASS family